MKKLLLILFCFPIIGISQNTHYELEFNSATQDYVQMPNTSAVIANKTAFSMSCWVNPQANTTHSGIMGFRNNTNADFYLLQLQNTNNLEARFRNSGNINYDIVASNLLDFNQWQHLALTYDGSNIHLYKDGVLISTTPANGMITQSTQSFRLAGLDYQNDVFHMNGRLDEVRLWDVALSQTEINNWMCVPIDLTHPNYNNLMGYWKLNEGLGITTADLSINGNNGTLLGGVIWKATTNCTASSIQLYGCTDSLACNFDSSANIDDGSCYYAPNVYIDLVGPNLELYANGGTTPFIYLWSTQETTQSIIPSSIGNYWCVVSDANNCTSDTAYFNLVAIPTYIRQNDTKKNIQKVINFLGREVKGSKNELLFYIYDDGTVEKRIVIE